MINVDEALSASLTLVAISLSTSGIVSLPLFKRVIASAKSPADIADSMLERKHTGCAVQVSQTSAILPSCL